VRDQHFDGTAKLHVAGVGRPTLFTITGTGDFADTPPIPMPLAEWMPVATYQYRGSAFIKAHLERERSRPVSHEGVLEAGEALVSSLNDYFDDRPAVGLAYRGQELCRLVLFQASSEGCMRWASVPVSVDGKGRAGLSRSQASFVQYLASDPKTLSYFGEDRYTTEHVISKGALSQETAAIWNSRTRISEIGADEGAEIARGIIGAAELATRSVAVPSGNGIGGPVTIYLLGLNDAAPTRLQAA
jgi:hypothetical protein